MKCKLTIYLADDDEDDRMMIRQAIETCITDVEIIEAIDGEDLINRVVAQDKGQPAVILTDMNMPRMNGLEATKLIKSNPLYERIPILMVSTGCDPQMIREAYARGINDYINKPSFVEGFIKIAEAVNILFKDSLSGNGLKTRLFEIADLHKQYSGRSTSKSATVGLT